MKDLKLRKTANSITKEELQAFKTEFNLSLPKSYEDFILKHNGGYPEIAAFDNPYEDGVIIEVSNRISTEDEDFFARRGKVYSSRTAIQTHQQLEKNIPEFLYPFGLDAGGGNFCISMREEDFGTIYQFFMDGTAEEPIYVTDSFENFVNALESVDNYEDEEEYDDE